MVVRGSISFDLPDHCDSFEFMREVYTYVYKKFYKVVDEWSVSWAEMPEICIEPSPLSDKELPF